MHAPRMQPAAPWPSTPPTHLSVEDGGAGPGGGLDHCGLRVGARQPSPPVVGAAELPELC